MNYRPVTLTALT